MKKSTVTLLLAGFLVSSSSFAGVRLGFQVVGWKAGFYQNGFSHASKLSTPLSGGLNFQAGLTMEMFFLEWEGNFFGAPTMLQSNDSERAENASYTSLIGLNAGAAIPGIPLEPYLGIQDGGFSFSSGTSADYGGIALKAGVNFRPSKTFVIKAEYKRLVITRDNAGGLPDGIETGANIYFIGLGLLAETK